MNDILLIFPVWMVFLVSLFPLTLKLFNNNKEYPALWMSSIAITGLFVSGCYFICCWPENTVYLFNNTLVLDSFRAAATIGLLILTALTVLISVFHPQVDLSQFSETLFLYLNALAGLMVLTWSHNLLVAFIGLELASMAFYLLIALGQTGRGALFASFKYFILGSVASAFLLYGMAFFVGSAGHFNLVLLLQQQPELIHSSRLLVLALMFMAAGFLFKVSIFPFQFWLPDVYRGSFTPLLILMAGGWKIAVFTVLYKWTKNIFAYGDLSFFLALLQWLAILSILFGNISALLQKDFKRMLLFSTIAHSGYLLIILLAGQMGSDLVELALLYYLLIYSAVTAGAFIALLPFEKADSMEVPLSALKGLAQIGPLQSLLILVFLLSLAGLPPTGGFLTKVFLFQNMLDRGLWWMLFWAILGSAIALVYYLYPLVLLYMEERDKEAEVSVNQNREKAFGLGRNSLVTGLQCCLALFVLAAGVFPVIFQFFLGK